MIIEDIVTDTFSRMIADLIDEGWVVTYAYNGIDSWIDYGKVILEKEGRTLTFEWTNWEEGTVEGPDDLVLELQKTYHLPLSA